MAGVVAVISFFPCTIFKQFRLESSAKSKHSERLLPLTFGSESQVPGPGPDRCGYSRPAKRCGQSPALIESRRKAKSFVQSLVARQP